MRDSPLLFSEKQTLRLKELREALAAAPMPVLPTFDNQMVAYNCGIYCGALCSNNCTFGCNGQCIYSCTELCADGQCSTTCSGTCIGPACQATCSGIMDFM